MAPTPSPAPSDFVVVMMTAPEANLAASIARTLVEERLAACVNIVPALRSLYVFDGKLCDDSEVLCIIKARRSQFGALRDRIAALHPYEVPEIIALPLIEGSAAYLSWMQEATEER